ncbi:hypothetical protein KK120_18740 [Virgibacillus dakarensis]|nr:hypothetical protein [Virgibacillus dakarensis]
MENVFRDYIKFSLYGSDYQVGIQIKDIDKVTVIVISDEDLPKPLIFRDLEDYIQQFTLHLQGIWSQKTNRKPCEEYKSVLNLINNQFIYCFSVLMDNLKKHKGYSQEQIKREYRLAYKRVQHLMKEYYK